MKQTGQLSERFIKFSNLPHESLPGQSVLEVIGNNRTLIENHSGVLQYTDEVIKVKVKFGHLLVRGKGLRLIKMTKQQLLICGEICEICFSKGV